MADSKTTASELADNCRTQAEHYRRAKFSATAIWFDCIAVELQRLEDEYKKAASSYGGICKTLDESGKKRAKLKLVVAVLESSVLNQGKTNEQQRDRIAELADKLKVSERNASQLQLSLEAASNVVKSLNKYINELKEQLKDAINNN